jgi:hypothetical protein
MRRMLNDIQKRQADADDDASLHAKQQLQTR